MFNAHRGEISATFDGQPYKLCLTLGALAELESAFGHEDMIALADRFSSGRISARDAARIIGAGLRGAGHDITDAAVLKMRTDDGVAGYVGIVARLLTATFGVAQDAPPPHTQRAGEGISAASADAAGDTTFFPPPRGEGAPKGRVGGEAIETAATTDPAFFATPLPMARAELDVPTLSPSSTGRGQGEGQPTTAPRSTTLAPNANLRPAPPSPAPFHGPR